MKSARALRWKTAAALRSKTTATCAVALLVAGCATPATGSADSGTSLTSAVTSATHSTGAPPTVAAPLVHPRWTSLPAAPIVGRGSGVSAWTGSEMIVWGGSSTTGEQYFADGAVYDPAHRTWQKLPAAPLSARSGAASVWTGRSLFIWGGFGASGNLTDGAVYTPSTGRWTKLPDVPTLPTVDSQHQLQFTALQTGSGVVLLAARSGDNQVAFRLYDPDRNTWTVEAKILLPADHPILGLAATAIGPSIYLFSYWAHTQVDDGGGTATPPITGSFSTSTTFGTDGFTVDPASGASAANRLAPPPGSPVGPMVQAAGAVLLFPPGQPFCGFCAGPYRMNLHGLWADPATGKVSELAHGPIDDLGPQYLWTGRQILAYDTQTFTSGPGNTNPQYPGKAAVYNPTGRAWTLLPSAPLTGAGFWVWTGAALIEWGNMYLPASANTGKTTFRAAGLELTG